MAAGWGPPPIDPGAISGMLDPWIKRKREQEVGEATAAAMQALNSGDMRTAAAAMSAVAGQSPALANMLANQQYHQAALKQQAEEHRLTREQAERHFQLTPRLVGGSMFGPGTYMLPPAKVGDPWQSVGPGGGTTTTTITVKPTEKTETTGQAETPEEITARVLAKYPPEAHGIIAAMERYDQDPASLSIKGGSRAQLEQAARELSVALGHEPYNSKEFSFRNKARTAFLNGPELRNLRSQSASLEHVATYRELFDLVSRNSPTDIPIIKDLFLKLQRATGSGPIAGLDMARSIVGTEVAKTIVGINPAYADREDIQSMLQGRASEEQMKFATGVLEELIGGQVRATGHLYETLTKRKDFNTLLLPRARAIVEHLNAQQPPATSKPGIPREEKPDTSGAGKRAATFEQARREAIDAIRRGAPRKDVLNELKKAFPEEYAKSGIGE